MKIYVKKICKFVKTDTVLVVSIVLAVISMLAVKPDRQYLTYIDFRTLVNTFLSYDDSGSIQTGGDF